MEISNTPEFGDRNFDSRRVRFGEVWTRISGAIAGELS
jgi:hypothetical protein